MKKVILIALSAITLGFTSCSDTTAQNRVTVSQAPPSNIEVQTENVPGFNVPGFANLLKRTKDPGAIEQAINAPNNDINNLDLNNDGNIDYLKVVESANNTLTVVDETSASTSVTVATLTVNPQSQTLAVTGNQAYCGSNHYYTSHYSIGDYLFMAYLLHPHRYYVPVYRYGFYPGYYRPYRSAYGYGYSRPYYRQTITRTSSPRSTTTYRNTTSSPRQTYTSPTRTSVSQPTRSQRSFQARQSAPVRSGGFGNSRSSSRSSSSYSRPSRSSSSYSRPSRSSSSRSSFGRGRSSFGGRRR